MKDILDRAYILVSPFSPMLVHLLSISYMSHQVRQLASIFILNIRFYQDQLLYLP